MKTLITKLGVPFIKYALGPILVAAFSFYVGQKNENQNNKGYEILAKTINVELQATLNHIDARLDTLETRMLRAENHMLAFRGPPPTTQPASQPVVLPPKPPKPVAPTKAQPALKAPPPPAKVDTAPGKIVVAPTPTPPAARPPLHKAKMQIRVPARLKDL